MADDAAYWARRGRDELNLTGTVYKIPDTARATGRSEWTVGRAMRDGELEFFWIDDKERGSTPGMIAKWILTRVEATAGEPKPPDAKPKPELGSDQAREVRRHRRRKS